MSLPAPRAFAFAVAASALVLGACGHPTAQPPAAAPCVVGSAPRAAVAPPPAPALAPAASVSPPPPFDPAPWLADLHALQAELSSHYANLEWAVSERGMDLPALRAKTEDRLAHAKTDAEAKRALESFIRAFGDAHPERVNEFEKVVIEV